MVGLFECFSRKPVPYLKIVGCWYHEEDSPKKRFFSVLYASICFSTAYVCYLPILVVGLTQATDSNVVVDHVRNVTAFSSALIKFINFYLRRKTILETFKILTLGDFNYEVCEAFNPTLIVKEYHKQNDRWKKIITVSICGVILGDMLFPLKDYFFHAENYYVIEDGERIYKQAFPASVSVNPFGWKTKIDYIKGFSFSMVSLFIGAMTFCAFIILFITMVSCVGAHLAVLAGAFKTIHPRCQQRLNIYDNDNCLLQNEMNKELIKCIKHLQTLHKIFKYLNEIFYLQTFAHAATFLSLMGSNMFKLFYQGFDVLELFAWSATMFDFFLCCWFGSIIKEGNNTLRESLYFTNWMAGSKGFKKNLIITVEVLRKPVYITIVGIAPLALETFVSMLKTSYSIFTMLKRLEME